MQGLQGLAPIIAISYLLSLTSYPSFVSYSYIWSIDFLRKLYKG